MASVAEQPDDSTLRRSKRNKFHLDVAGLHRSGSHSATGCAVEDGFRPATNPGQVKRRHSSSKVNGVAASRRSEPTPPLKKSKLENQRVTPDRPPRRERKPPARHSDFVTATLKNEVQESVEPVQAEPDVKPEEEDYDDLPPKLEPQMPFETTATSSSTPPTSPHGIIFECMKCPAHFDSRNGLGNHMKLHGSGKGREFACDVCDFSCTNMKTLRTHRQVHGPISIQAKAEQHAEQDWKAHQKPLPPKIDAIDKALNLIPAEDESAPSLSAHGASTEEYVEDDHDDDDFEDEEVEEDDDIDDEEEPEEKPRKAVGRPKGKGRRLHQCTLCPYTTRHSDRYIAHGKGHERKSGYKCPLCSFMSISSGFLKRHCECHREQYPWPPMYVTSDGEMHDEKKDEDTEGSGEPCSFSSTFKNSLNRHVRRKHSDEEVLVDQPGEAIVTTRTDNSYKKYIDLVKRIEAGSNPETPEEKKVKKSAQTMFVCENCPFTTTQKSELVGHELGHDAELDYKCPECTFAAATVQILHEHQRVHLATPRTGKTASGERFEKCPECPYTSKHTCDMKAHREMHIGKREFACTRCTYSTKRNHVLITHNEMHEREEKRVKEEQKEQEQEEEEVETPMPKLMTPPMEVVDDDREVDVKNSSKFASVLDEKTEKEIGAIYSDDGIHRFHCAICKIDEGSHEIFYEHTRQHTDESIVYSCTQCNFTTDNGQTIVDHEDAHPQTNAVVPASADGMYRCRECPYVTNNYGRMWHHNQKHKKPAKYRCEDCTFQTGLSHVLREHAAVHAEHYSGNFDLASTRAIAVNLNSSTNGNASLTPSPTKENEEVKPEIKEPEPEPVVESAAKRRLNGLHASASSAVIASCPTTPPALKNEAVVGIRKNDSTASLPAYGNERRDKNKFDPKNLYQKVLAVRTKQRQPDKGLRMKQCPECPYEAENETVYDLHREMHFGSRPHKCSICSYSCQGPESLYTHLNLHAPHMSSDSASLMRRYMSERRRTGQVPMEKIPIGAKNVLNCRQCNYRTLDPERFQKHQTEHVLLIQQRLMTAIKRASAEEPVKSNKRPRRPNDKMLYCPKCSFKCDTAIAYTEHLERHGATSVYSCSVCDYGDNTQQVVVFHERNHHYDTPLTHYYKEGHLKSIGDITTKEELLKTIRFGNKLICCKRCDDFACHEMTQLVKHWEKMHNETAEDQEKLEEMKMGLVPQANVQKL